MTKTPHIPFCVSSLVAFWYCNILRKYFQSLLALSWLQLKQLKVHAISVVFYKITFLSQALSRASHSSWKISEKTPRWYWYSANIELLAWVQMPIFRELHSELIDICHRRKGGDITGAIQVLWTNHRKCAGCWHLACCSSYANIYWTCRCWGFVNTKLAGHGNVLMTNSRQLFNQLSTQIFMVIINLNVNAYNSNDTA